jgi:hypothetical protein
VLDVRKITPPQKRPPSDPLDGELFDMARSEERGFVKFPPPPPPLDAPAAALARAQPAPLAKLPTTEQTHPVDDVLRVVLPILICIAFSIPFLSAWYIWTH